MEGSHIPNRSRENTPAGSRNNSPAGSSSNSPVPTPQRSRSSSFNSEDSSGAGPSDNGYNPGPVRPNAPGAGGYLGTYNPIATTQGAGSYQGMNAGSNIPDQRRGRRGSSSGSDSGSDGGNVTTLPPGGTVPKGVPGNATRVALGSIDGTYFAVNVNDIPVTAPAPHNPPGRWQKLNGLWVPSDSQIDPVQTTQGFFSMRGGGQTGQPAPTNPQALQLAGAWVTMPRSSTSTNSNNPQPPQQPRQPQMAWQSNGSDNA